MRLDELGDDPLKCDNHTAPDIPRDDQQTTSCVENHHSWPRMVARLLKTSNRKSDDQASGPNKPNHCHVSPLIRSPSLPSNWQRFGRAKLGCDRLSPRACRCCFQRLTQALIRHYRRGSDVETEFSQPKPRSFSRNWLHPLVKFFTLSYEVKLSVVFFITRKQFSVACSHVTACNSHANRRLLTIHQSSSKHCALSKRNRTFASSRTSIQRLRLVFRFKRNSAIIDF